MVRVTPVYEKALMSDAGILTAMLQTLYTIAIMFYLIYFTYTLPQHWVAWASDSRFYVFPAQPGGWREREIHRPLSPLTPALEETARIVAAGSGYTTASVKIVALDESISYRLPEAARATGINAASLRSACWQGRVPGVVNQGRSWRLPVRALHHYIAGYRPRPGALVGR